MKIPAAILNNLTLLSLGTNSLLKTTSSIQIANSGSQIANTIKAAREMARVHTPRHVCSRSNASSFLLIFSACWKRASHRRGRPPSDRTMHQRQAPGRGPRVTTRPLCRRRGGMVAQERKTQYPRLVGNGGVSSIGNEQINLSGGRYKCF